jgi:xanthine/uracil permease
MAVMDERLTRDERSLGQLLKELTREISTLLRQEVELAKTEMSEKASRAGESLGALAVGGGVALLGALSLLAAAIYGLTALLDRFISLRIAVWLAPLIIGVILAAVGYALVKKALARLKGESLAPRRTAQSLRENKEWLRQKIS